MLFSYFNYLVICCSEFIGFCKQNELEKQSTSRQVSDSESYNKFAENLVNNHSHTFITIGLWCYVKS